MYNIHTSSNYGPNALYWSKQCKRLLCFKYVVMSEDLVMKKDPLKEIKIIVLINPHQRSPADMRPPLQEPPWTQPSPGRLTK